MKKSLLALTLVCLFSNSMAAPTPPVREVDRIVAVVNKDVITLRELQRRVQETVAQLNSQKAPIPSREVLQKQALEQMISEQVQLQYARDNGLKIEEAAIDTAILDLAKQNRLDLAGFKARVASDGIGFERLREIVRKELTLGRLRDSEVGARIGVTDTEVNQVLKSEQQSNRSEFLLSSVLIAVPPQASESQVATLSKKAEKALADLESGQTFAKVSANYSDAPNARQGGSMGWRNANSLPSEFAQMLAKMQPGQHTDIIRTQQGFFIFQLQNKRDSNAPVLVPQYRVRHILVRTNEAVSESEAKLRIDKVYQNIQGGAPFAEMAKMYSEDGSNSKGGELGWVNLGDLVPAFEGAMVNLPIGQVSPPVRTPFGWHLILVEEKRDQDVSSERKTQQARQQVHSRKMEQAYADWVRQLRDSAFVENRLERQ